MTGNGLDKAFAAAGAAAWGGLPFSELAADMTVEAVQKAEQLCPGPKTVLVAAFPYYAGERAGNLSLYARGLDYHTVVTGRLNTICNLCDNTSARRSILRVLPE